MRLAAAGSIAVGSKCTPGPGESGKYHFLDEYALAAYSATFGEPTWSNSGPAAALLIEDRTIMTGISGWQLDHADDDREVIARVGQHLQGAHDLLSRRCRTGTLAAKVTESSIFVDSASGLVAAIDGKPRWTQAGLAQTARIDGNGAALAAAYREHGAKLFNALTGTFSFAIIDPANCH